MTHLPPQWWGDPADGVPGPPRGPCSGRRDARAAHRARAAARAPTVLVGSRARSRRRGGRVLHRQPARAFRGLDAVGCGRCRRAAAGGAAVRAMARSHLHRHDATGDRAGGPVRPEPARAAARPRVHDLRASRAAAADVGSGHAHPVQRCGRAAADGEHPGRAARARSAQRPGRGEPDPRPPRFAQHPGHRRSAAASPDPRRGHRHPPRLCRPARRGSAATLTRRKNNCPPRERVLPVLSARSCSLAGGGAVSRLSTWEDGGDEREHVWR